MLTPFSRTLLLVRVGAAISTFLAVCAGSAAAAAGLPPVTVQLSDFSQTPSFQVFAKTLPQGPVQVEPLILQASLATPPTGENAMAAKIRAAYQQLAIMRPANEPRWEYGLNPLVWSARAKGGGTAEWWNAYKMLPASERPLSEMFPFAYDFTTTAAGQSPPQRTRARQLLNQALDTAMGPAGDIRAAAELASRAVTADPTYPLALYNTGLLHMSLNNYEAAIRLFSRVKDTAASPIIGRRSSLYLERMRKQFVLLLNSRGSQRRIYTDHLDAAWAMANAKQPYAAVVFAGQAATYDPEEQRPDAHLVVAMVCADLNRPKDVVRWLQYSLERARGSSSPIMRNLLTEIQAMPEVIAALAPPVEPPPADAAPVTPPPPVETPPVETPPVVPPPPPTDPPATP